MQAYLPRNSLRRVAGADFSQEQNDIIRAAFRQAMADNGWTQADLAERLNYKQQSLSQFLLGHNGIRMAMAAKFAGIVGRSIEAILSVKPSPTVVPVGLPRYPNLLTAIERCREAHERAIEQALQKRYSDAEGWPVERWVEQIRWLEEVERRRLEDPTAFQYEVKASEDAATAARDAAKAAQQKRLAERKRQRDVL